MALVDLQQLLEALSLLPQESQVVLKLRWILAAAMA
jgi:hypothetical protein